MGYSSLGKECYISKNESQSFKIMENGMENIKLYSLHQKCC